MAKRQAIKRGEKPIPGWLWLLGGVALGAVLAVAIMLTGGLPGEEEEWRGPRPAAQSPDEGPPQPDELIPERDYDFYTLLPEMEVVIPEREISEQAEENVSTPAADENYLLQAGSFQNAGDADSLKAQLALQGFVAGVHTVTINGDDWHRVRIGPFNNYRELEAAQEQLEAIQIETIALKVKE